MYDDVLLPTDGSSATTEALDHALAIATDKNATIHVLYVLDKRHFMAADDATTEEVRRSLDEEAAHALDDAKVRIEDEGVDCRTARKEGIPHRTISKYAETEEIDMIIMGTHGKTGVERLEQLGSTTERVVKNADQPVLVVEIGT
jgi:nucleotide-binding universal stress UspA family protein